MAQPTLFDFNAQPTDPYLDPFQYLEQGLRRTRIQRVRRFQLGDGYEQVTPDGVNNAINRYDIRTRPLTDAEATFFDDFFTDLNGDFFFARFPLDDLVYRYRLEPNQWSWEVIGDSERRNVISFAVRQIYDIRS